MGCIGREPTLSKKLFLAYATYSVRRGNERRNSRLRVGGKHCRQTERISEMIEGRLLFAYLGISIPAKSGLSILLQNCNHDLSPAFKFLLLSSSFPKKIPLLIYWNRIFTTSIRSSATPFVLKHTHSARTKIHRVDVFPSTSLISCLSQTQNQ